MKLFFWLVTALLALVFVDFAVSNRVGVALDLWPLPDSVTTWLFLPVLSALALGTFVGLLIAWTMSWRVRRTARERARRIEALERDVARLEQRPQDTNGALLRRP